MSRIGDFFENNLGRKALIGFVTAGDPTLEHTVPAMHALVAGGTDIIELGIPFSDPEAEGPTIQQSSERALANKVTLHTVLEYVREFRKDNTDTAIVLMGYLNSVLALEDFAVVAKQAGVDGLIMVNLPPEEAASLSIAQELRSQDLDLIYLIAPTTTAERIKYIANQGSGFLYYVSLKGITGASHLRADEVAAKVAEIRQQTNLPVCVGFGIKDAATAAAIAPIADGVVVGSALVNLMADNPDNPRASAKALTDAALALRQAVDSV